MPKLDPLLEEVLVAAIAVAVLGAVIAVLFRLFTGISPWPVLILGEVAGFGFGLAILAVTSARRRR
jgi:hypothetical protein